MDDSLRSPVPSQRESNPLRIMQVGLGGFGLSWAAEVLNDVNEVDLVACVDPDPIALLHAQKLTSLAATHCFATLPEALDSIDAHAVLISAPLGAHVVSAMTALHAGKHVLLEKPFAPTLHEAQMVVDVAASRDLTLMISQNYRYFPAVRTVAKLLDSREYGSVDAVHVDFRRYDNAAPRGQSRHYLFPEPMLVDMAIHHFDLMRLVLDREPVEIYCRSWNPSWSKFEAPAEAVAIVRFEDDILVSYRGSWISAGDPTAWAGEWRIELSEGEISWTSRDGIPLQSADEVSVRRSGDCPQPVELAVVDHVDRAGSLHAFMQSIQTGCEPESSGRQNLKTLALTLAAVESARMGRPVTL